ncbi:MAG: ABC transporter permease [Faecalibacterium sp.]|nr:ABC transporter permease [Faecalibacterium sp.]
MLASIFSPGVLITALEMGCIFALVALALFISYSTLNIADLSTDGCFTLGCAVCCAVIIKLSGNPALAPFAPVLALLAAMATGVCSGFITAFLQTRLGVESILAGIVVNTGLYTINLAVMGFASQLSLLKMPTIYAGFKAVLPAALQGFSGLILSALFLAVAGILVMLFLGTRLGLSIRATGDNADMVRASSINPAFTITVGLCVSSALTALSGALLAQYQKGADINVGTGMVTIALASLIIGETLIGKGSMPRRILGVALGSCIYRFAVAVALRFNLPAAALKLVSAIIVAIAISMPAVKKWMAFEKRKAAARRPKPAKGGNL